MTTNNLIPITPENMKKKIEQAGRPVDFRFVSYSVSGLVDINQDIKIKRVEGSTAFMFNDDKIYLQYIAVHETPDSLSISLDLNIINMQPHIAVHETPDSLSIPLDEKSEKNQGFDPANLTFNGVEIQVGDRVGIACYGSKHEVRQINPPDGMLGVEFDHNSRIIVLGALNITKHIPAQKSELEEVEEELKSAKNREQNAAIELIMICRSDENQRSEYFDCYYQARKRLEELTDQASNNN